MIVQFEVIARGHLGRILHELRPSREWYRGDGLKVYAFETRDGTLELTPEIITRDSRPEKHLQAEAVRVAGLPMDDAERQSLVLALKGAEFLALSVAEPPIVKPDDVRRKLLRDIALQADAILQSQGAYVDENFSLLAKI